MPVVDIPFERSTQPATPWHVLGSYGFRPFFLGAGIVALTYMVIWILNLLGGTGLPGGWPPVLWHAHEMLNGVLTAALAGFMLTAVPSWTGTTRLHGRPLLALAGLWLAGRVTIAAAAWVPGIWVAVIDVAFLPALMLAVAPPLLRQAHRNRALLLVLLVLTGCQFAFHTALWRADAPAALLAIHVALNVLLLLVTIIGGRIIPAFTQSALLSQGIEWRARSALWLDRSSVTLMIANALVVLLPAADELVGGLAATIALAQLARLTSWRAPLAATGPLVWALYGAYGFLPLGFAMKAWALLTHAAAAAFWLHLLTIGALTGMVMAVMTRAALGHTGRALRAAPLTTLAYAFLLGAVVLRVFGLAPLGLAYPVVLALSALAWCAAFSLYLWVYAPLLLEPRADGRPG